MRCEVLETKFQTSDRQYEGNPLAPTSVQFVLWSQWRQGAGFVKKLPSWAEHPPPRSAPRPVRNYLVTCSRGALSEAAEAFQEKAVVNGGRYATAAEAALARLRGDAGGAAIRRLW